jgi:hypothetical protein
VVLVSEEIVSVVSLNLADEVEDVPLIWLDTEVSKSVALVSDGSVVVVSRDSVLEDAVEFPAEELDVATGSEEPVVIVSPDSVLDDVGKTAVTELNIELGDVVNVSESVVVAPPDSVDDEGEIVEE